MTNYVTFNDLVGFAKLTDLVGFAKLTDLAGYVTYSALASSDPTKVIVNATNITIGSMSSDRITWNYNSVATGYAINFNYNLYVQKIWFRGSIGPGDLYATGYYADTLLYKGETIITNYNAMNYLSGGQGTGFVVNSDQYSRKIELTPIQVGSARLISVTVGGTGFGTINLT